MKKVFSSAKEIFHYVIASLDHYDPREGAAIAFSILEYFGISRTDVLTGKQEEFNQGDLLHTFIYRLNNWEPIQYVLGKADFYGKKFIVNGYVLIPRQETEELVKLIAEDYNTISGLKVLDIGTGSGCIAVTLASLLPKAEVHALDKSKEAIKTASENATINKVKIEFHQIDILNAKGIEFPSFDIIVSNPPYVMEKERKEMKQNVLQFEPSMALFVPDENPLLFYQSILDFSTSHLNEGGACYFEINEKLGNELQQHMKEQGWKNVEILKDLNGKDRFIKGIRTI
jgi:release factor glutamine methyltransferase